jgi:hypothetical protein
VPSTTAFTVEVVIAASIFLIIVIFSLLLSIRLYTGI